MQTLNMQFFFSVTLLLAVVYGEYEPDWDSLKTTWNINPFAGFYKVPLTDQDAKSQGWEKLMSCNDDTSPGYVWWKDGDLSSMPIYNAHGYISGIVLGMNDPGESAKNREPFTQYTMPNGTIFYGVQGNFRDTEQICDVTNPVSNGWAKGGSMGDRLTIVNGDAPGKDLDAPLLEDQSALSALGFRRGACFWAMGAHYWRYDTVDQDCNTMYPVFLLYTKGKLNAWGIALAHDDRPNLKSKRWEHPGGKVLYGFFAKDQTPKCLPNQGTLSTQHVFMTNPAKNTCPLW
eukprot:478637_1